MGTQQSKPCASVPTSIKSSAQVNPPPPPPYAIHHASQAGIANRFKSPKITALSPPRWKWSNEEYRQWIYAFLIHCGRDSSYANTYALAFHGPGSRLFHITSDSWHKWFGPIDGAAFWGAVLEARVKEVPSGIHIHHFWPRKSDGTCSKCGKYFQEDTEVEEH